MSKKGALIVFSGPSGVGKGTLLPAFFKLNPDVSYSVSATTRAPREGEKHGKSYHFISEEEFLNCIKEGKLLEYACYNGNYYGTLRHTVLEELEKGRSVVLEIEVQGALQISELCPDALMIFVMPPSFAELRRRLEQRHTEPGDVIECRMRTARDEMKMACKYDYIVINDDVDRAAQDLYAIVRAHGCRRENMEDFLMEVCADA